MVSGFCRTIKGSCMLVNNSKNFYKLQKTVHNNYIEHLACFYSGSLKYRNS
jgi:hypothetical protein